MEGDSENLMLAPAQQERSPNDPIQAYIRHRRIYEKSKTPGEKMGNGQNYCWLRRRRTAGLLGTRYALVGA